MSFIEHQPGPDSRNDFRIHSCDVPGCRTTQKTAKRFLGLPPGWLRLTIGRGSDVGVIDIDHIDICPSCWGNPSQRLKALSLVRM